MRILYKYIGAAVLVLVLMLHGCKKELGALPKDAKVDANTILDQATAQIALNGAYYNFANATTLKTNWLDHQAGPGMLAGYIVYGYGNYGEEENRNASFKSYYWSESYVLLNTVNGLLKGVNALPDQKFTGNRKKEILAEARFLRAYAHFKLLNYYAEWYKIDSQFGVLLRDELSTLSNISKARSSVKDSYNFILSDLDEVIANGPAANPNYYVTKWAGMALKMRVLMCRGAAGDYTEVISLANTLIKQSPYSLEPVAEDIFHKNGLSSKEVILGLKPQAQQELDANSKTRQYWPGVSFLYTASAKFKTLLNNDPRQSWMTGSKNTRSLKESYFFTKYIQEGSAASVVSETDYALRLTETYLLEAEAIVRSGGALADAKKIVHEIQAKAGISATTNTDPYLRIENANQPDVLLQEIYIETAKSMVAEDGIEWLALLRLPFETVKTLKPTIASQAQYILPVPKTEFTYNPAFGLQNPGYSTN